MKLESLTDMVKREFPGSGLWVEQEGEMVYLKRQDEVVPIAGFKGNDPWSLEDLLVAARQSQSKTLCGISFVKELNNDK